MPTFPRSVPPIADSGAYVTHWDATPRDWKAITDDYTYADGGKDFNEISDDAPRRWRVELTCNGGGPGHAGHLAAKAIADVYEDFFNTYHYSQVFNFEDKYGDTWSNVRVEEYDRTHDAHKSWVIYVKFTLIGIGSEIADITPPTAPTGLSITDTTDTEVEITFTPGTD
jgi:hypothetical protein